MRSTREPKARANQPVKILRHNASRFAGSGYLLKCHDTERCLAC
jgi:hypothetical protein